MTDSQLRDDLYACLAVERWVDDVAAHAPFAATADLLRVAADAATPLSPAEIDEALAHHPRIGEKPSGVGAAQSFSRSEQSSADADDEQLARAIAEGNARYEERFGRVFLIRAAGRSRAEILAELTRRLTLDDATELAIVGEQLRDIALLRLEKLHPAA
ncbi:2-oxo-4-hydroxy-4-carboxy-5-ureidoimidazoline decarboxylase [Planctomonas psychrotolerans]|uniref:2-oxo-4-hydroxy-4-carboxy-5-ureidoimidazoline decarboxylase n=1 Tax=Planctomonas psychrotolerans TaxID=2528712 RepID=UPI001238B688|nr:2-oxo-4-hydroxy-4-carboxy-5-ureidoimidazoline decarboxylase [Planctomonas psychrotolerans]